MSEPAAVVANIGADIGIVGRVVKQSSGSRSTVVAGRYHRRGGTCTDGRGSNAGIGTRFVPYLVKGVDCDIVGCSADIGNGIIF